MSERLALIVANSDYDDPKLTRLITPKNDAEALAHVLSDSAIGEFKVTLLVNESSVAVRKEIARLYQQRKRNDLLFLYYSGHGIQDDHNDLYFAAKDTETGIVSATAIDAAFVRSQIDKSNSQRKIVVLDCCYSGLFARGAKALGARAVSQEALAGNGYGRVILTASNAVEYAWEGDKLLGEGHLSVFTHFLVKGLQTGEADLNGDGEISVDELYDYIYQRIMTHGGSKQTPQMSAPTVQGRIIIARSARRQKQAQQAEPVAQPSVMLTLAVTPDTINVGDEATWTAVLINDGDDDLHQVTVRRDETLLGDIADFAVGQEQRFTFTTRPSLTGQTIKVLAAGIGSTGKMVRAESSATVQVRTPERLTITSPVHLDLVYVPAGEFLMGSDPTIDPESSWSSLSDETPQHRVYVSDFYIGKYPITNAQYAVFVKAGQGGAPTHWKNGLPPTGKDKHPVVNVSWFDAVAFCKWLSQKTGNCFRLPTEAEWEKAARGTDGRIWPWGNNWDKSRLNNSQYRTPVIALSLVEAVVDMARLRGTTPVDQYSPRGDSPYGAAGMSGNVYEWCADWYKDQEYQRRATSVVKDPQGPESGHHRIVRGGDYEVFPQHCRAAARNRFAPDTRYSGCGFRFVFDPA